MSLGNDVGAERAGRAHSLYTRPWARRGDASCLLSRGRGSGAKSGKESLIVDNVEGSAVTWPLNQPPETGRGAVKIKSDSFLISLVGNDLRRFEFETIIFHNKVCYI